jgi:mannosyltransferase OCH1-like enzyme
MRTWQERHPDWQYRLWTDDDLPTFPFCNRARFDQAQNIGEKADILRYEILNAYGGLYVDTDFECLAPFDPLHPLADFYVGLEAPFQTDSEPAIGNALIASIPHHPILEELLATIAASPPARDPYAVQCTTGPNALRTAFLHNLTSHRNIALPYTFFYPLPSCKRDLAPQFKTSSYLQKETFAVHYWEATWTSDPFDS